jgi:hypothetical protein
MRCADPGSSLWGAFIRIDVPPGRMPVTYASSPRSDTGPASTNACLRIYCRTNAVHRSKDPDDTHTYRQA